MQDTAVSPVSVLEQVEQTPDIHTIATLIGFLPEIHAIQLLRQSQWIDVPRARADLRTLWQQARQRITQPPMHDIPRTIDIKELPKKWQHYEQELKSRETYLDHYAGFSEYRLWCVPTAHLLTPQWYADLDYVQILEQRVPLPGDWEGVLNFVFEEDTSWNEPFITALNDVMASVAFRTPAQNVHVPGFSLFPPQVRQLNAREYEISLKVQARPNYLQVCRIQGKYIIINGIHHVLALWKAGWKSIPCLLREAKQLQEIFQPNALGFIHDLQNLQRPSYIQDFLNEDIAPRFRQRQLDFILRVLLQSETMQVPRNV